MTAVSHSTGRTPPAAVTFRASPCQLRWGGGGGGINGMSGSHAGGDSSAPSTDVSSEQHPSCLRHTHTHKKKNLCSRILLFVAPHNSTSRHSSTVGSDRQTTAAVLRPHTTAAQTHTSSSLKGGEKKKNKNQLSPALHTSTHM